MNIDELNSSVNGGNTASDYIKKVKMFAESMPDFEDTGDKDTLLKLLNNFEDYKDAISDIL